MPISFIDASVPAHPFSIHPSPHDKELLSIVRKIAPSSIIFESAVNPIDFCYEIQIKLTNLLEKVCVYSVTEIGFFISRHKK